MRKILLTVLLLLPFSAFCRADEKSHKELVEQLFTIMNLENGYNLTLEEMIDIQVQSEPMLKPVKQVLSDFFHKYVSWDVIKPELTRLYMDQFNEGELRDLVGFFSTPVGILWLEKSQDMAMKVMELSQNIVNKHQDELEKMIIDELTRRAETENQREQQDSDNQNDDNIPVSE